MKRIQKNTKESEQLRQELSKLSIYDDTSKALNVFYTIFNIYLFK